MKQEVACAFGHRVAAAVSVGTRLLASTLVLFALTTGAYGQALSPPGPDQSEVQSFLKRFIEDENRTGWGRQDRHLSGVVVGKTEYSVHRYLEVYYSKAAIEWFKGGKVSGGLADGAAIIALEYDAPEGGALQRVRTMVRQSSRERAAPADGWYWSTTTFGPSGDVVQEESKGEFGMSTCFGCHGSANNDGLVFMDGKNGPFTANGWTPSPDLKWPSPSPPEPRRSRMEPLAIPDPAFLTYFKIKDKATDIDPNRKFPAKKFDHVWAGSYTDESKTVQERFITSDQCMGCHNAAVLLSNTSPNMWYPEPDPATALLPGNPDASTYRNFSPYGEWSASINALSGRDPVWHAQVDFERKLRPELAKFTTNTCFSCHGAMAVRQLQRDQGPDKLFNIEKFYAIPPEKDHKYGALARDGVSCAVCHQISAHELGVDPEFIPWKVDGKGSGYELPKDLKSYTAMFKIEEDLTKAAYWGPYRDGHPTPEDKISSIAMDRTLGQAGKYGPQIRESRLCASCHTVLVPALPVGYKLPEGVATPFHAPKVKMSFEQTTYFEWRNSLFENETNPESVKGITCQGCHMASHKIEGEKGRENQHRIVNVESNRFPPVEGLNPKQNDFTKHPVYRHVLLGINYFVFEMYEQFSELLGTRVTDPRVPKETLDPTLNARDWIENHAAEISAEVRLTKFEATGENLEVEVEVTNFAGHKFPTGAGFRRAFLTFEVLDENGEPLWSSGSFSSLGVLGTLQRDTSGRLKKDAEGRPTVKPLKSEETVVPGESQPHHKVITRQDQVQIYETRALDSGITEGPDKRDPRLQTTVLGIYYEYKDNRILPLGYSPPQDNEEHIDIPTRRATGSVLVGKPDGSAPPHDKVVNEDAIQHPTVLDDGSRPFEVVYDADYWSREATPNGQDHTLYRIPLADIQGWTRVRAQLHYQTIPPYYLRDRFETAIPEDDRMDKDRDMYRLIHIASRLNLKGTPAENWSLKIGERAELSIESLGSPTPHLTRDQAWTKLKKHYNYLALE